MFETQKVIQQKLLHESPSVLQIQPNQGIKTSDIAPVLKDFDFFMKEKINEFKKMSPDFQPKPEFKILLTQLWEKMTPNEKKPFQDLA